VIILITLSHTRNHNNLVMAELANIKETQQQENQFLMSRINYGEERQRMVLFLRDEIFETWTAQHFEDATMDRAYDLASIDVTMSEMFPQVGALTIASTQFVESGWGQHRLSSEGAMGLNQFMPSTGLLICTAMGRAYNIKVLNDDKLSTEMAAKYLDLVFAHYGNWEAALADYNGGPYQAVYYTRKDPRLSKETKDYVPAVLAKKAALEKKLLTYKVDITTLNPDKEGI
jgi:hypothetical protein